MLTQVCCCCCAVLSHSVVSDAFQPHGLWPTRLLCPWDFPGRSTGVGCHALFQGIFPTQGWNLSFLHCRQTLYHLSHQGGPRDNASELFKRFQRNQWQWLPIWYLEASKSFWVITSKKKLETKHKFDTNKAEDAVRNACLVFTGVFFWDWASFDKGSLQNR